jgi:asparagine synthase (glutamine-hydrolysing)
MSVQFGRWNCDGMPPLLEFLDRVNTILAPYGPDDTTSYNKDGVSVLYRAFHTTKESRRETQPHISESGTVITWDGRLDNRAELIHQLNSSLSIASADVSILSAAYERWGTDCFAKLIGDWTLSIWNPNERSLILAKDPIGTRHLFYSVENDQVTWSTILDPLVLFAGRTFALDEEYIAGWFSFFPAAHLTPYVGIDSVPPSCFVRLERGRRTITKYWDFDPGKRIRYHTDAEYEKHFRTVFAEAIRRRLRSDTPILAELSGGMDSSSIVCMADTIIARGVAETPRLDTISYYTDSEPNWNERPYFTKVEEKRGRVGCHINVSLQDFFKFGFDADPFAATPGSIGPPTEGAKAFVAHITAQGSRIVLSGIGGDEVLGGVPTPIPELADHLAEARFGALAHQLKVWALNKRKPWFHLLLEVARQFLPPGLVGTPKHMRLAPWLNPNFVKRNRAALSGYHSRLRLFGAPPSFQESVSTVDVLRRQLASTVLPCGPSYEKRHPYLDRDLLEFICALPREQLVRPGQRRSLMRRALVGIVPDQVLNRKRKAFLAASPIRALSHQWPALSDISQNLMTAALGIVNEQAFTKAIEEAIQGNPVPIVTLTRTLGIDLWLRGLRMKGIVNGSKSVMTHDFHVFAERIPPSGATLVGDRSATLEYCERQKERR